jgi:hypothetical protein
MKRTLRSPAIPATACVVGFLVYVVIVSAQSNKTFSDTVTKPDPNALVLPADDQRQLDLINDRIAQMKPQLEDAKKQQADAQAKLAEANSFISQYNQIDAVRMAFLFRIAADVCHCETKDLEFSADGKSVMKKKTVTMTAPVTSATGTEMVPKPKP